MTDQPLARRLQQADLLSAGARPAQDAGADLGTRHAYGLKGVARFRVNVYRQKGYAACLRALGSKIPSVQMLNLLPVVLETSARPRGLVLVTEARIRKDHHPGGPAGHQPHREHPRSRTRSVRV